MKGAAIGITAARRAREQADLVRALGGRPVIGSAVRADLPAPDADVAPMLLRALARPLDHAVFLTGVGVEMTFDVAARAAVEPELRRVLAGARVVARGPKPRRALRKLGVRIDWVVDPPSTALILESLIREPLVGRRVLVQSFGPEPDDLVAPLRSAGAEVLVVSPYQPRAPEDPGPARTLAVMAHDGDLAAVSFTSAGAVERFLTIAAGIGISPHELRTAGCLMCAVGPVTREAMLGGGLPVDVEPETPRMGSLYHAIALALRAARAGVGEATLR